jgi:hypothetical protein
VRYSVAIEIRGRDIQPAEDIRVIGGDQGPRKRAEAVAVIDVERVTGGRKVQFAVAVEIGHGEEGSRVLGRGVNVRGRKTSVRSFTARRSNRPRPPHLELPRVKDNEAI